MSAAATTGPLPPPTAADRPYWDGAKAGLLRLPRCTACRNLFFPPGGRCPKCGSERLAWETLTGRGTIWSWVVMRRQYFPTMPPPYTVVRIQLEEGPFLITNLIDSGGQEPTIGAPVRVVFQSAADMVLPQFTFAS